MPADLEMLSRLTTLLLGFPLADLMMHAGALHYTPTRTAAVIYCIAIGANALIWGHGLAFIIDALNPEVDSPGSHKVDDVRKIER